MAIGSDTFSNISGAVNDLFAGVGYSYKAKGAEFEKKNYELAADLAMQNEKYTEQSQAIKQAQLDRQIYKSQSGTQADVAGAGLAMSGSALDILHESASQGALTKQVLQEQGYITEQGYKEQAESYKNMASAAQVAIDAAHTAETGSYITGAIKGVSAFMGSGAMDSMAAIFAG